MSDPVTIRFDRANRLLKSRVNLVNTLSSAQLSQKLLPEMRMHAFFSAGVGSARVIEKLREVSDDYTTGKMNLADARLTLKEWLFDHAEKNPGDAVLIDRLATTARLNLILDQNRANAAAVAQYELDSDPDVVALLPYKRITPTTSRSPRESHKHLEGLILPASHPYWHTHTPPTDFNCKHGVELIDEEEAAAAGYTGKETAEKTGKKDAFGRDIWTYTDANGRKYDVPLSESGFELNVHAPFGAFDFGTIPEDLRLDIIKSAQKSTIVNIPEQKSTAFAKSISDVFSSVSPKAKEFINRTSELIDSVHYIPAEGTQKYPVKYRKLSHNIGGRFIRDDRGNPLEITINNESGGVDFIFAHEFGHALDNMFSGYTGMATSGNDSYIVNLIQTMKSSRSVKLLKDSSFLIPYSEREYYLRDREMFARAYAQWITCKTKDERLTNMLRNRIKTELSFRGHSYSHGKMMNLNRSPRRWTSFSAQKVC